MALHLPLSMHKLSHTATPSRRFPRPMTNPVMLAGNDPPGWRMGLWDCD